MDRGDEAQAAYEMLAAHVATLGRTVAHSRQPYWKIPNLDECSWAIELKDEPEFSMTRATTGIASGWFGTTDSLSVDRRHGETFHPALSSVFVELEPDDWARHAGIPARFDFGERVHPVSDASGWISATVVGRSFDASTGWAYALQEDPTSHVFCVDEADLGPSMPHHQ